MNYEQEEIERKITFSKFKKTLNNFKRSLQTKLDRGIIYENFGQAEVRKLKDIINPYDYDCTKRQNILQLIDSFDNWCMNASLKN